MECVPGVFARVCLLLCQKTVPKIADDESRGLAQKT
jgi:hypothetical protein